MRKWAIAGLALAAMGGAPLARAETPPPAAEPPAASPAVATQDEGAQADRLNAALLAADLDAVAAQARQNLARNSDVGAWAAIALLDDAAAGRLPAARGRLAQLPDGAHGGAAQMFEPFLLLLEGQGAAAQERLAAGAGDLPDPLTDIARALVYEGMGRLTDAARVYGEVERAIDARPPPAGEPQNEEELFRALAATRTSQVFYRAALVQHRLNRKEDARRLYSIVAQFAPNSADLRANLARLERNEGPVEPALDGKRAFGRWLLFLSDHLQQTEGLAAVIRAEGDVEGLASPTGTMLLLYGVKFDPSADDWTLAAASQLSSAKGYDGAERLLARIPETSVFAADAQLSRASILVEKREDAAAAAAASRAITLASDRWSVFAGAGDVLRLTGRDHDSIAALDRAFALAPNDADRADALSYRAYAHRFAGRLDAAAADAEAALRLDRKDAVRFMAVSVLMDNPRNWREGVTIARELFAEQPDSGLRLNALGYSLIQRPESLEEGYRLLWRGFNARSSDYAIIDSLGWAYYLYGAMDQARVLIERAAELSKDDPNPEVLDHLGDIYWRARERDRARDMWRQALAARPDALRRAALEGKVRRGLTTPAPATRDLPRVDLPRGPRERGDL
ncbi:MAG: hypothetical protein JNJ73_17910 [Hyphomonadaceae bacterium]|nr:hypothetical protein [Hyphomonadaceae bacterium]